MALLGGLIAWVPIAALAGILVVVACRMVDRNVLDLLRQRSTLLDFGVVAAVVVTAVAGDLVTAAAVGLALAILLFVHDQVRGSVVRRRTSGDRVFSKRRRLPDEMAILEKQGGETAVYELQGTLFFGTTDQLLTELEPDLETKRHVILDLRRVHAVDFTATHMLRPSSNVLVFPELDAALEWTEEQVLAREQPPRDEDTPLPLDGIELLRGLFLIRRGLVRIVLRLGNGREHHLATFARGDFFGDLAFLDGAARSADAVAATPTDVFALSRARFERMADGRVEREVFARLARGLAVRLRLTDAEVRVLAESYGRIDERERLRMALDRRKTGIDGGEKIGSAIGRLSVIPEVSLVEIELSLRRETESLHLRRRSLARTSAQDFVAAGLRARARRRR